MFSVKCDFLFFPNRIRVTNSRTGQTIDRTAKTIFSSDQRLIANKDEASRFIRDVLQESNGKRRSFAPWPTATAKIVEGPSSSGDRDDVRDLLTGQGFVRISVD